MRQLDFNKFENGLVPVIIQDNSTLKVLMLGYMNSQAYQKSLKEGLVTFFSRSKGRLWTKGETSGNFLHIKSMEIDCDCDTLLIRVECPGVCCHTGTLSCFNDESSEGFIGKLEALIQQRKRDMPSGAYTTRLFEEGTNKIAQKVGEEAVETVIEAIAQNDQRMIYEMSDLIYHMLVLLTHKGFCISDIEKELQKRHK